MPMTKIKYYPESMLKTVESYQKAFKIPGFNALSDTEKRQLYAAVFASRSAANCERGKKRTLKVGVETKDWEKKRNDLILSYTFNDFITKQSHPEMIRLLTTGHGGAAEEAFEKYVLELDKLPADVPARSMPTAEQRIDAQKKKLQNLDASSEEAVWRAWEDYVGALEKARASLKPCPFCGCSVSLDIGVYGGSSEDLFQVVHPENDCILSEVASWSSSLDELVPAWNNRIKEGSP